MEFLRYNAQGWYSDPYRQHQARWFSDGSPTALVRDDGVESIDPAPETWLKGQLEPAPESEGELLHTPAGHSDSTVDAVWDIFVSTGGD